MIFDICVVLGSHKIHQHKMVNLTDKSMCPDCSTDHLLPCVWSFLKTPYPLRHNIIEIKATNNLTMAFKWKEEMRVSHFKSKARYKLSEKGMSKAIKVES